MLKFVTKSKKEDIWAFLYILGGPLFFFLKEAMFSINRTSGCPGTQTSINGFLHCYFNTHTLMGELLTVCDLGIDAIVEAATTCCGAHVWDTFSAVTALKAGQCLA